MKRKARRAPARPRKRMYKPSVPRLRVPKHDFLKTTRKFWVQNWTPGTGGTTDFWKYFAFTFGDMPNFTDYANIYDSYKITSVLLQLVPRYDGFNGNDTVDTVLPGVTNQGATRVHVAIDPKRRSNDGPTGAYTSATLNTFLERSKTKTYVGNKMISILLKHPCVLTDMNSNANAVAEKSKWLQTNISNVAHQGIHVFLQDINLTGTFGQSFDVFYTFNILFKGQR